MILINKMEINKNMQQCNSFKLRDRNEKQNYQFNKKLLKENKKINKH